MGRKPRVGVCVSRGRNQISILRCGNRLISFRPPKGCMQQARYCCIHHASVAQRSVVAEKNVHDRHDRTTDERQTKQRQPTGLPIYTLSRSCKQDKKKNLDASSTVRTHLGRGVVQAVCRLVRFFVRRHAFFESRGHASPLDITNDGKVVPDRDAM